MQSRALVMEVRIWLFCSKLREWLELAKSKQYDSFHLLGPSQARQTIGILETDAADGIRASRLLLVNENPDAEVGALGVVDPRVATHAFLLSLFGV